MPGKKNVPTTRHKTSLCWSPPRAGHLAMNPHCPPAMPTSSAKRRPCNPSSTQYRRRPKSERPLRRVKAKAVVADHLPPFTPRRGAMKTPSGTFPRKWSDLTPDDISLLGFFGGGRLLLRAGPMSSSRSRFSSRRRGGGRGPGLVNAGKEHLAGFVERYLQWDPNKLASRSPRPRLFGD